MSDVVLKHVKQGTRTFHCLDYTAWKTSDFIELEIASLDDEFAFCVLRDQTSVLNYFELLSVIIVTLNWIL